LQLVLLALAGQRLIEAFQQPPGVLRPAKEMRCFLQGVVLLAGKQDSVSTARGDLDRCSVFIDLLDEREQVLPGAASTPSSAGSGHAASGDSDRAGTAGAATQTERCGAQRTTSGNGAHDAGVPPESDPVASGDARDCPAGQAATDDWDQARIRR
jgi:hypothetical protein